MIKLKDNSGQILLIVVLTTVVALTVGLSVVSRSVTNLKISKQSEESQRAFQAAEAGIQKALKGGHETGASSLGNNASYDFTFSEEIGNEILLNGGGLVMQDKGIDVWLSIYPNFTSPYNGNVRIYWGTNDTDCTKNGSFSMPALEILLLSGSRANPIFSKYLYDSCAGRTKGTLGNILAGGTVIGQSFSNSVSINATNGLIMKVIPLYNSGKIAVVVANLPAQGVSVESTGSSGDTKRKINYFESYPQIPAEIFPYSIISQ